MDISLSYWVLATQCAIWSRPGVGGPGKMHIDEDLLV
jgi:hypothetical protein